MKKIFLLLLFLCSNAWAVTFTDLKFGQAQIADSQWNTGACLYTATCQIYSKNPGTAYKIPWYTGQLSWASGDYVKFVETGNSTNPYNAIQYNSLGTQKAVMGTGHIINMGSNYFFFVGNDNDTGQLFSMTSGFNSTAGVTWTGTLNPTVAQVNTYAANGSTTPLAAGQTAAPPVTYTTTYSTQTTSKVFGNRTLTYDIPMKTVTNNSTGAATTSPVTPATVPSGYISIVPYTGGGGWQIKSYTYTAPTSGTGYLMFAFRHDINYWVIDNVSVKANNTGANLLVNGGLDKVGLMSVNVGGRQQTVAAPTAWGLAYQTNQSTTLGGGYDSGMWYDTSTGSYGAIYQNVNFTAGTTYTISFMVASDYNSNGDTVQMAVYAGACEGSSTACTLPASTGMTTAVTPTETYTVGCTTDCPVNPGGGGSATWPATSDITTIQTTQKTAAKSRVAGIQLGNSIYIDEKIGSSGNMVTIEQTGNSNKISGLAGTDYAVINGDNNVINIKQGDTIGKNLIEFGITGNTNTVSIWQARNPTTGLQDGNESGGHYLGLNVTGSTNTLSLKQSNDGGTSSGHFAYVDVTGNNNNGTLKQMSNGEKTFFGVVNGNTNVFDITQQGTGSYFDLSLTGNGHSVTANQKDAGSHKATVNLTNSGGASTVTLVQQGSTAQNINITQQCATLSGCSVSVTQGQ
jgi:hypothetical protein